MADTRHVTWSHIHTKDLSLLRQKISQLMSWRTRITLMLREAGLPPSLIEEIDGALDIHGDTLVDLYTEAILEAVNRHLQER